MKMKLTKILLIFTALWMVNVVKTNAQCAEINTSTASFTGPVAGQYTVNVSVCAEPTLLPIETTTYLFAPSNGTVTSATSTLFGTSFSADLLSQGILFPQMTIGITNGPSLGNITFENLSIFKTGLLYSGVSTNFPSSICMNLVFTTTQNPSVVPFTVAISPTCSTAPFMFATPLPVKIQNLNAQIIDNEVKINWLSTEENNLEKYFIQKSIDGKTFDNIGTVMVNTGLENNYSFTDYNVAGAKTYYRLQMVDFDGKNTFSDVVSVMNKINDEIVIVQNPVNVKEELKIVSDSPYEIYNIQGAKIDAKNIVSGIYFVRNTKGKTAKFVVN